MITIDYGLSGHYKLVVSRDAECCDVVSSHEFKNLILDNGLELLGTVATAAFNQDIVSKFHVGSGASTPSISQTSLDALIASTTQNSTTIDNTSSDYTRGYLETVFTQQFAMGSAAGNLSEIGVGPTAGNLFSRARILDGSGNPTTITVLSNEFLTVYYTLRCSIPQVDQTYNITANIDGVSTPVVVTIRPASANSATANAWHFRTTSSVSNPPTMHAAEIVAPIAIPSVQLVVSNPVRVAYVALSKQVFGDVVATISQGNVAGRLVHSFVHRFGPGCWQYGFAPPLPKDNTKTITLRIGYSWNRV